MAAQLNRETIYDVKEAAAILGVTPYRLRLAIREGNLKGTQVGSTLKVTGQAVYNFLEAGSPLPKRGGGNRGPRALAGAALANKQAKEAKDAAAGMATPDATKTVAPVADAKATK